MSQMRWSLALVLLVAACSRGGVGKGIRVEVVDEVREATPFGAAKVEHRFGAGMDVYLAPAATPLAKLARVWRGWQHRVTNTRGRVGFPEVEGQFHVLVDANGDGLIDKRVLRVPSGSSVKVVVTELAEPDGDNWLQVTLDKRTYRPGDQARVFMTGFLAVTRPIDLEIWRDATDTSDRALLLSRQEGVFFGPVSQVVSFEVDRSWPLTPALRQDDYLVIPKGREKYFSGARFSLVQARKSNVLSGLSITINDGAAETESSEVTLQFTAQNAVYVAWSNWPTTPPETALRYPFTPRVGHVLLPGEGLRTVYAIFYDELGNYSDPVSDSIVVNKRIPKVPDPAKLHVVANPPGTFDFLVGDPAAVDPNVTVRIYADRYFVRLLGQTVARADGSFGPVNIGDGSVAGNVEKPWDFVYVVALNGLGRVSAPTAVINDSTPPVLRAEDISGAYIYDANGNFVGNPGDVFRALYSKPTTFAAATDAVGGQVDFSRFGGPSAVELFALATDLFGADVTIPNLPIDDDTISVRMRIRDAAYNYSPWVVGAGVYAVDTVPPGAPTILAHEGGNRQMRARWTLGPDIEAWAATLTTPTGQRIERQITLLEYVCQLALAPPEVCLGAYNPQADGLYTIAGLDNCDWYYLRVRAIDNGGNYSGYSNEVSDHVILPPPVFQTWGGLATDATGLIVFSMRAVTYASTYDIFFSPVTWPGYAYTSTLGAVSPVTVATGGRDPFLYRQSRLPLREWFKLTATANDGACKSAYAPPLSAATDLRVEAQNEGWGEEISLGGALAAVSDITGDGLIDLLVGAPTPRFVATVTGVTADIDTTFGYFFAPDDYDIPGTPLAVADLDGNGLPEYIVGSPLEANGSLLLAGAVRIYDSSYNLIDTLRGERYGLHFGFSVVNLGDVDGIPGDEFAVGGFGCAHRNCGFDNTTGQYNEGPGKVVIYQGTTRTPLIEYPGIMPGDYFGVAITGGRDYDGDSEPDLVVGAPGMNSIFVFKIGSLVPLGQLFGGAFDQAFGAALATLDVSPGVTRIVVGAPGRYAFSLGAVYAYSFTGSAVWYRDAYLPMAGPGFGAVLATGGDVNGDGIGDVVVGAPNGIQSYFYGAGSAYVLDGATGRFLYEVRGGILDGALGYSVLLPGELNGRGPRSEWVVGAPGSAYNGYQSGRTYIFTTDP